MRSARLPPVASDETRADGPASSIRRAAAEKELADDAVEFVGLLDLRHVAAVVDDHFSRPGNRPLEAIGARRVGQLVVLAPHDQRRGLDAANLLLREAAASRRLLHLRN